MEPGPMWGGVPLKNGNNLVQNENSMKSVELNRNGEIVWEVSIEDIQSQLDALAPGLGKINCHSNLRTFIKWKMIIEIIAFFINVLKFVQKVKILIYSVI